MSGTTPEFVSFALLGNTYYEITVRPGDVIAIEDISEIHQIRSKIYLSNGTSFKLRDHKELVLKRMRGEPEK